VVAFVIADLYRKFFEVWGAFQLALALRRVLDLTVSSVWFSITQRVGPSIRAVSPQWQIRPRDDAFGIFFGQLRLTRLYSYDHTRIYPEIAVVTPR
jgi:hypothetical protein